MSAGAEPQHTLTDEQRARVESLGVAKRTLGPSSVLSASGPAPRFDVTDVLRVAHYVIAGRDLLDEPRLTSEDESLMAARTEVGRVNETGALALLIDPSTHGEAFNVYADAYGNAYTGDQVTPVHIPAGSSALSGAGGPAIPHSHHEWCPAHREPIDEIDDRCTCGHPDCGAC